MIDNELSANIDAIRARGGSNEEIISRVRENDTIEAMAVELNTRTPSIEDIVAAVEAERRKLSKNLNPDDRDNIFFNAGIDAALTAIQAMDK